MFSNRVRILVSIAATLVLVGCSSKQPEFAQKTQTKNKPRDHVVVSFTHTYVNPTEAHVNEGGRVAWENMAGSFRGAVLFPPAITDALTCTELRPQWVKTDEGVESMPALPGLDEIALPCPLEPGTYEYKIKLFDNLSDAIDPQLMLSARIVVHKAKD
jgi:hypothetical protein